MIADSDAPGWRSPGPRRVRALCNHHSHLRDYPHARLAPPHANEALSLISSARCIWPMSYHESSALLIPREPALAPIQTPNLPGFRLAPSFALSFCWQMLRSKLYLGLQIASVSTLSCVLRITLHPSQSLFHRLAKAPLGPLHISSPASSSFFLPSGLTSPPQDNA